MGHTMVVAVPPSDLERLDALVDAHQTAEMKWQAAEEQAANILALRGTALRATRASILIERDRLREAGRHRVNRWRALAPALHSELNERGLLRGWEPVPEGAQRAGQTLGGTGPYGGAGLTARLCLTLPDDVWEPLQRGVYWTNQPHIQALQSCADRWGTGATTRRTASPEALEERARTAAQITTTGAILRTALHHTVTQSG